MNSNLKGIKIENINRIYSGKPGCMCGCRGNYQEGAKAQRILANMATYAEANNLEIQSQPGIGEDATILYVEGEQRVYAVYLNK